ncbi:MAG: histidinol-phosphate transaminase [Acidobacteriota bacterium]|nr:histidinol-phosphate transaminase [Acidobacteriota bacterium]
MPDFDEFIPEHIRGLARYVPGKPIRQAERESGIRCIKMASNENPFGPSPKAIEAIRAAVANANFYPDNDCAELRQALAERHQLNVEQILVTDGSTALLDHIARTLLVPGRNAVTSQRSFIVYPIVTQAAGGRMIQVPMREHAFDLDAVLAAIDGNTRIVFLANPNNPTGTMFDAAATDRFLDRVPEHVLVVLDEAYCDFAAHFAAAQGIDYSHSLDYVRQGRRVIVLRTFSKAHGLAGLRVGYAFGPPALLQALARVRPAFSVSGVAEAGALAAFGDTAHVQKAVENNTSEAPRLAQELSALGLAPIPTYANFLYLDVGEESIAFARRMQAEGIIVRALSAWGAPNAIRVTVGAPEHNRAFLAALKKARQQAPAR